MQSSINGLLNRTEQPNKQISDEYIPKGCAASFGGNGARAHVKGNLDPKSRQLCVKFLTVWEGIKGFWGTIKWKCNDVWWGGYGWPGKGGLPCLKWLSARPSSWARRLLGHRPAGLATPAGWARGTGWLGSRHQPAGLAKYRNWAPAGWARGFLVFRSVHPHGTLEPKSPDGQ